MKNERILRFKLFWLRLENNGWLGKQGGDNKKRTGEEQEI